MPDWIMPIDSSGAWAGEGLIPIDAAHRQAVMHRGAWLHVLTDDDSRLLLVRRSSRMVTCPGTLSIIGEHHQGSESDISCATRAVREELPGLAPLLGTPALKLVPLRSEPRWFLFDYPLGRDGAGRFDRCLISEFVVHLAGNSSAALARLHAATQHEVEREASVMEFVNLGEVQTRLRRQPESFCAPELFPAALLDSYVDVCASWHREYKKSRADDTSASVRAWQTSCSETAPKAPARGRPAMRERFHLARIVHGRNRSTAAGGARRMGMAGAAGGGQRMRRLKLQKQAMPVTEEHETQQPRRSASAATNGVAAAMVRKALLAAGLAREG